MSWMKTGYNAMDNAYEHVPKSRGPRRVWMPPEHTTRVLFLEDDPTCYWEHQFFYNQTFKNWEPCKKNNGIDEKGGPVCPICESIKVMSKPSYPSFIGLHSVIVMTPFFTKKDNVEINFTRQIYASKMGSKEKPGILQKLYRLKAKHGRMKGLCFDIYRSGAKTESCGDEFEIVSEYTVEPKQGAINELRDQLIPPYLERRNANAAPDNKITMEKFLEQNPWEPFDFESMLKDRVRSNDELRSMGFGAGNKPAEPDGGGGYEGSSGSSESDSEEDDDIPY